MRKAAFTQFLLASLALSFTLSANAEVDTLNKIRATGQINIGYRENSIPFSYLSQDKPTGYAYELTQKIAERIKSELKLPALKVNPIQLTSFSRFDNVREGLVDIECGSTSNTKERQARFAFSNTYFVSSTRFATHKYSKLNNFKDLSGKSVAVTFGSTAEQLMQKHNAELRQAGGFTRPMKIVAVRTHADGLSKLEKKEAEAFVLDDVLLYALINEAAKPDEWKVVGETWAPQAYACMLRKDDPKFKALVDSTLAKLMQSGEAEKMYQKWFMSPIPPHGRSLNMPMSAELKKVFATPGDQAYD